MSVLLQKRAVVPLQICKCAICYYYAICTVFLCNVFATPTLICINVLYLQYFCSTLQRWCTFLLVQVTKHIDNIVSLVLFIYAKTLLLWRTLTFHVCLVYLNVLKHIIITAKLLPDKLSWSSYEADDRLKSFVIAYTSEVKHLVVFSSRSFHRKLLKCIICFVFNSDIVTELTVVRGLRLICWSCCKLQLR